jgi:biopolymer transport protein ExbD
MASGGGSMESGEPEFQVAPMIDVLLTMLIFFMMITSAEVLKLDQDINLPVASDALKREKNRGEVIVNVRWNAETKKASYAIDQVNFPKLEDIKVPLERSVANAKSKIKAGWNPNVRLVVRAPDIIPAVEVNRVMAVAGECGLADIAFSAASKQ